MTVKEYQEKDNTFNESMFVSNVNNIFKKTLTAIMLDELDEVKHFWTKDLEDKITTKVNTLNEKGYRQMYEELNVANTTINDIDEDNDKYIAHISLEGRHIKYILDLDSSKVVSGIDSSRTMEVYHLVFTRKKDLKSTGIVKKCPSCGNSLYINDSGKCDFCGHTYNLEDHDWVLSDIDNI